MLTRREAAAATSAAAHRHHHHRGRRGVGGVRTHAEQLADARRRREGEILPR